MSRVIEEHEFIVPFHSISALLSAPNPDDPLANDVAELWKVNESEAIKNAKEWTQRYAFQ